MQDLFKYMQPAGGANASAGSDFTGNAASGANAKGKADDDVIDADFDMVDDDKKK